MSTETVGDVAVLDPEVVVELTEEEMALVVRVREAGIPAHLVKPEHSITPTQVVDLLAGIRGRMQCVATALWGVDKLNAKAESPDDERQVLMLQVTAHALLEDLKRAHEYVGKTNLVPDLTLGFYKSPHDPEQESEA